MPKWHDKLLNADIRATYEARNTNRLIKIEILYYPERKVIRKRLIYHADEYEDFYDKGAEED